MSKQQEVVIKVIESELSKFKIGWFSAYDTLKGMVALYGADKVQEALTEIIGGLTQRAADSPSGYSVKSSMPKGYKFAMVNCPNCQRPVKENWLVKHIKSGCKIPVTNKAANR